MNRIKCFLTGGHRYEDSNLRASSDEFKNTITFTNGCVKCGKSYEVQLPFSAVMSSCLLEIYTTAKINEANDKSKSEG